MILVTGAAGKTGQAVTTTLASSGIDVRVLVRHSGQQHVVQSKGARSVMIGDLCDLTDVQEAVKGVVAVYHIAPNMHPDEFLIGKNLIEASKAADVTHFVMHSVLHPQAEKMPHHWQKMRVEEFLFESGLPNTILQPTAYMQNILANWELITEKGVYAVPYPSGTRLSLVDLQNVADIAAKVLTEEGHYGAIYELVGTEPLSQVEVADELSSVLRHPIRVEEISLEEWEGRARIAGKLSEYAIETLLAMFRYYANYGLVGNPRVLGFLLGRNPTSLARFVKKYAHK